MKPSTVFYVLFFQLAANGWVETVVGAHSTRRKTESLVKFQRPEKNGKARRRPGARLRHFYWHRFHYSFPRSPSQGVFNSETCHFLINTAKKRQKSRVMVARQTRLSSKESTAKTSFDRGNSRSRFLMFYVTFFIIFVFRLSSTSSTSQSNRVGTRSVVKNEKLHGKKHDAFSRSSTRQPLNQPNGFGTFWFYLALHDPPSLIVYIESQEPKLGNDAQR